MFLVVLSNILIGSSGYTVYPKKYAHGFCFAVLCCGYTLTDFPISIRLTSLALWQSNDCPSASKATLMNMDKYFMWIHYERLHNHNKAKHNKTVCIFLGIYCTLVRCIMSVVFWECFCSGSCRKCLWNCEEYIHVAFGSWMTLIAHHKIIDRYCTRRDVEQCSNQLLSAMYIEGM